tara:strand:- start:743 stop:925 length:183 start_codon:yes stop_codon:yes gene_type:complete
MAFGNNIPKDKNKLAENIPTNHPTVGKYLLAWLSFCSLKSVFLGMGILVRKPMAIKKSSY